LSSSSMVGTGRDSMGAGVHRNCHPPAQEIRTSPVGGEYQMVVVRQAEEPPERSGGASLEAARGRPDVVSAPDPLPRIGGPLRSRPSSQPSPDPGSEKVVLEHPERIAELRQIMSAPADNYSPRPNQNR
jgi:hypothetical protein